MIAFTPSPLEVALVIITGLALVGALATGLWALGLQFVTRHPDDAAEVARRIGKDRQDITADVEKAQRRRLRQRRLILITAALAGLAALCDFIIPPMLGLA